MPYELDHVVLWVADPARSAAFYRDVVGLEPVRLAEFEAGEAPFVSMRVTERTLIDLVPLTVAPQLNAAPGAEGSAGNRLNHVCLTTSAEEFAALRARLEAGGHPVTPYAQNSFGARGAAPRTYYFADPDGNVLEARYYA
ncbi:catechol 2,3-dioxygenase-like lactoylglutathione lyase family enzyme [Streptomyces sp. TLI_235]|nr:VOC family protein [Streptomyces sp. TLI_235]PBC71400.1 catechol 2,3-dioxygenase-like lactoylglutathione lyase family enzyme [Streptomyces sp. TLI_235]